MANIKVHLLSHITVATHIQYLSRVNFWDFYIKKYFWIWESRVDTLQQNECLFLSYLKQFKIHYCCLCTVCAQIYWQPYSTYWYFGFEKKTHWNYRKPPSQFTLGCFLLITSSACTEVNMVFLNLQGCPNYDWTFYIMPVLRCLCTASESVQGNWSEKCGL